MKNPKVGDRVKGMETGLKGTITKVYSSVCGEVRVQYDGRVGDSLALVELLIRLRKVPSRRIAALEEECQELRKQLSKSESQELRDRLSNAVCQGIREAEEHAAICEEKDADIRLLKNNLDQARKSRDQFRDALNRRCVRSDDDEALACAVMAAGLAECERLRAQVDRVADKANRAFGKVSRERVEALCERDHYWNLGNLAMTAGLAECEHLRADVAKLGIDHAYARGQSRKFEVYAEDLEQDLQDQRVDLAGRAKKITALTKERDAALTQVQELETWNVNRWRQDEAVKAAVAAEREACAKVCNELAREMNLAGNVACMGCAATIRARGQADARVEQAIDESATRNAPVLRAIVDAPRAFAPGDMVRAKDFGTVVRVTDCPVGGCNCESTIFVKFHDQKRVTECAAEDLELVEGSPCLECSGSGYGHSSLRCHACSGTGKVAR